MFLKNFVVYLTVNEQVIREKENGLVKLPFGTEYSICLKNLESRLATAKISVDGEDVLDGNELVVYPNNSVELKGFMKDNVAKNKFKFIEKTKQIEDYRGNRPDDGLVRVEFKFQKQGPIVQQITYTYKYPHYYPYLYDPQTDYTFWTITNHSSNWGSGKGSSSGMRMASASLPTQDFVEYSNNYFVDNSDGLTVKGNQIDQQFSSTFVGEMESNSYTMVLKLTGYKNGNKVEKELTTKDKIVCSTCGNQNKYNSKFCGSCGSFLE
jgi:hypothetical protein